jgi:hypothetical protein
MYLGVIPGVDAYVATASSLARSALRGAGRAMIHYTRQQVSSIRSARHDTPRTMAGCYPALMTELISTLRSALDPADIWRTSVRALDGELAKLYHQHGGASAVDSISLAVKLALRERLHHQHCRHDCHSRRPAAKEGSSA